MTEGFLREIAREIEQELGSPAYGSIVTPSERARPPSLRRAIEKDRAEGALVLEFKRVSPGQEDPNLPVRSVAAFVASTRAASPSAYSCLATLPRFGGSPQDVADLANATDRPILFKDFVLDRRQIDAAARAGASAVLLIARLESEGLLREPLSDLAAAAHERGLEVLLEFHDRSELSRGANVAADMCGVNARDLDTLRIDREVAERTIAEAASQGLRPLLGLSGVESPSDARRFWDGGVDAILVGTSVARANDPAAFAARLRGAHREGRP